MTDKSQVIEEARIDILVKVTENKGSSISKEQLKEILKKYFDEDEVEALEIPNDTSTYNAKLTTKDGNYKIKVSDIYSDKFANDEELDTPISMEQARGMFVKYNVTYTDAYYYGQDDNHPAYNYTENNGWRVLNYDETTEKLDIISTGIPAKIYYYDQDPRTNSNLNSRWWATYDQVKSEYIDKGIGSTNFKSSTAYNSNYRAYYAAYGLKYNLAKIIFIKNIQAAGASGTYNMGFYANLNNQQDSLSTESSVISAFSDVRYNVTGIRNVDMQDIKGNDIGIAPSSWISGVTEEEDSAGGTNAMGLFTLSNIKNMDEMNTYIYQGNSGEGYWLASPKPGSDEYRIWYMFLNGYFSEVNDTVEGIRPVISLSGVRLRDRDGDTIFEIENT